MTQFFSQMFQLFNTKLPVSPSPAVPLSVFSAAPSPNLTAAWAGNSADSSTASSSVVLSEHQPMAVPVVERAAGVSECCLKEALVCEVSPLGYHLPSSIKEKIW